MKQQSSFFQKKTTINCGGTLIDLTQPTVMGIINVTPDSFYANSRIQNEEGIINRVLQIINEGGTIVDIGAYSSRPNAVDISIDEEVSRLKMAISLIKQHAPNTILSIDTFRSQVVREIYDEFGAFIINDISAGGLDGKMIETAGKLKLPYIAMHMKGSPQTMVNETDYNDLLGDIIAYFVNKIELLLEAGVNDIILDLGYGFSKSIDQNYELLAHLDDFKIFELPLLVGLSRKSMIYSLLKTDPSQALNGTTVLNTVALQNGADILRVHDVKEAVEAIQITTKLNRNKA